ncbi:uncharacterized protein LOC127708558 [Mytilus californianus]|uniref:uncharacterized protein LOC127708558 n=1 Tax=Mytilus californianus TaxID=6549 RepID=UPI0022461874|nr:uncharacterized protein LOC127708558 [Mytilus californianus]
MSSVFCEPCQTEELSSPAIKWCTNCEEALCTECERSHRKSKASRNHVLVDLLSAKSLPKVKVQECLSHEEQKLDLFCIDHDELCCRLCMTENHRTCAKVVPVDVVAKDVKSSTMVAHVLQQADDLRNCLGNILEKAEKESKEIDRQGKEISEQVSSYKNHIIDLLDEAEQSVKSDIEEVCTKQRTNVTGIQEQALDQKTKIESYLTNLQALSSTDSNEQTFLFAHYLKSLLSETESLIESKRLTFHSQIISFEANKDILSSENIIGEIGSTIKSNENELITVPRHGAQASGSVYDNSTKDIAKKLEFTSRLELTGSGNEQIRGIAVSKNGKIVLCDHKSYYVLLCSAEGKYLDKCNVKRQPWNIVILHDLNHAVVSLTGNIHFASLVSVSGHLQFIDINTMTSLREIKLDFVPLGLALVGNYILAGTWNQIYILSANGSSVGSEKTNRSRCPVTYIAPKTSGSVDDLYYSTTDFLLLCSDGNTMQSFPFVSGRPRGIALDDQGYIYLATREGQLLRISLEGKLCDTLIEGVEGYGSLWAISFSNDYKQLFVVTENGGSVSVFKLK